MSPHRRGHSGKAEIAWEAVDKRTGRHTVSWVALTPWILPPAEGDDTLRVGAGRQQAAPGLGFHSPRRCSPMIPLTEAPPSRHLASRAALERGLIGQSTWPSLEAHQPPSNP